MGLLDRLFGRKKYKQGTEENTKSTNLKPKTIKPLEEENLNLPEGKIVSISDEVIDTDSRESVEKFKHNLKVLMGQARASKKINKFMLVREDDFFPTDWEWRVLSKNTNLEKVALPLSLELRKAYALRQSGIKDKIDDMGISIPTFVSENEVNKALSEVDKNLASVLLPSRFRSTKHFTVNVPLGLTGDYNGVNANRDYIILDNMDAFLNSGYAYSLDFRDAYIDVTHESLPISQNAIVLVNDENYERIMTDEKVAKQLAQRKVIRFKGDESLAINMALTQMGVLPYRVGAMHAEYDDEIYSIMESSLKELAKENGLMFMKSHGGELKPNGGHFSNYYDGKNKDYEKALNDFYSFLAQKFSGKVLVDFSKYKYGNYEEFIEKIGIDNLISAIEEYNEQVEKRMEQRFEEYKQDRSRITPAMHEEFVKTVKLINDYYEGGPQNVPSPVEYSIQQFFQGDTVREQMEAASSVRNLLYDRYKKTTDNSSLTIGFSKVAESFLRGDGNKVGVTSSQVLNAEQMEEQKIINAKENNVRENR